MPGDSGAPRTLHVGLTGGIGSGKSAVAELLRAHGALIIDADQLAREVVEPGTPGLERIGRRFGPGVLRDDGHLDRRALARIVFADPDALAPREAHVQRAWRTRHGAQLAPSSTNSCSSKD